MKNSKELSGCRKVSKSKDHLRRGPGTFLTVKAIALDVQWTAGEETVRREGLSEFGFNGRCRAVGRKPLKAGYGVHFSKVLFRYSLESNFKVRWLDRLKR